MKALSEVGTVRLAAERAGVDFSTAYARRRRHPDFAAAWDAALAGRKGDAVGTDVLEAPRSARGGESDALVVRPDGKMVRAGAGRWSVARERRFLTELASSANVRRAAMAAGVSTAALYARRLKHGGFRAAWDLAIDAGKARLHAYLIEAADRTFDPASLPIPSDGPRVSVSEAVRILRLKGVEPAAQREASAAVSAEEHEAAIERIIEKLGRLRERTERERREAGWSEQDGEWIPPGWVRADSAADA
ncbi:hypothetical protein SH584_09955 [Sphingomonas sp. LY29]|uniref:hypothetical protein n=1 Tax=Sphingomonas sp. LY29 TaxID=3095341 RepID=UPI002D795738|nr:hypothetical protein [Sphingomonas sp. LY29]WRP25364.1 hypothetical protein SH584_09955 [Sphingomonas sp. LY29]